MCHVNLRATPSTSARVLIVIRTGANVTVAATVTGTSWRTTCAGVVKHGTSWVRISAVNGKSARSPYGVTYVYAASGLFKSTPTVTTYTRYAACSAYLRRAASQTVSARSY